MDVTSSIFYQHLLIARFTSLFDSNRKSEQFEITLDCNEGSTVLYVLKQRKEKTEGIIIINLITSFEIKFHHSDLRKHWFILSFHARISIVLDS